MLTISNIPDSLEMLYADYISSSSAFLDKLPVKDLQLILGGSELNEYAEIRTIIFIKEGYLKLYKDNCLIRLYNSGEFIVVENNPEFKLISDFATEVYSWQMDEFYSLISDLNQITDWLQLREQENRINLNLAGIYLGEDVKLDFKHQTIKQGETIINKGDQPTMIYEMISGEAIVFTEKKEVGRIFEGEIFGEISFLTESLRVADVIAASDCVVRVLNMATFERLISLKPQMILSISKTLAGRIVQLNDRLIRI